MPDREAFATFQECADSIRRVSDRLQFVEEQYAMLLKQSAERMAELEGRLASAHERLKGQETIPRIQRGLIVRCIRELEAYNATPGCVGCVSALLAELYALPGFARPMVGDGLPCGECHLQEGDTCEICGAVGR